MKKDICRGYYMAARGYEFYLRVQKMYLSRVSEANEWEILSARDENVLFIL